MQLLTNKLLQIVTVLFICLSLSACYGSLGSTTNKTQSTQNNLYERSEAEGVDTNNEIVGFHHNYGDVTEELAKYVANFHNPLLGQYYFEHIGIYAYKDKISSKKFNEFDRNNRLAKIFKSAHEKRLLISKQDIKRYSDKYDEELEILEYPCSYSINDIKHFNEIDKKISNLTPGVPAALLGYVSSLINSFYVNIDDDTYVNICEQFLEKKESELLD